MESHVINCQLARGHLLLYLIGISTQIQCYLQLYPHPPHIRRTECPTPNLSFLIKHCNILGMGHVNNYNFSTILEMRTMACHIFNSAYTFNWTPFSSWDQTPTIECLTVQSYRKQPWEINRILDQQDNTTSNFPYQFVQHQNLHIHRQGYLIKCLLDLFHCPTSKIVQTLGKRSTLALHLSILVDGR